MSDNVDNSPLEQPAAATNPVDSKAAEVAVSSVPPAAAASTPPAAAESVETIETVKQEAQRLKDQLLRTAADFDNFRKRSRREVADAERKGREDQLRELLPVFDNLERAAAHSSTASDVKALSDGIAMVLRQFLDTLGRLGVERVSALGQPFDPEFHEAVQQIETREVPPGAVAAEVLVGYRMGDRLVRPAMVVVAKAPPAPATAEASPAAESPEPSGNGTPSADA